MRWTDLLKNRPHVLLVPLFLFFGILCVFITPPIYVADESAHFYRAYQVSEGKFVSANVGGEAGGSVPKSLSDFVGLNVLGPKQKYSFKRTLSKSLKINLNSRQSQNLEFTNVAIYPTVNYVPQAVGIDIGRIFTSKVTLLFYLARLANLFFLCACLFWAVRTIPFGKFPLMIIGLLPMVLYAGSSISADTFVIASVALYTAYLLKLLGQKEILTKDWVIVALLAAAVALSKQTYFILVFTMLAIPFRGSSFVRRDFSKTLIAMLAPALLLGGWLFLIRNLNSQPTHLQNAVNIYANPHAQVHFIAHHVLTFAKLLIGGIGDSSLVPGMLGVLGVNDLPLPTWSLFSLFLILFLSFGTTQENNKAAKKLNKLTTGVISVAVIVNVLVILTGLYVFWSTLHQGFISGVRGRYFIPLLIMLIPVLALNYKHSIKPQIILYADLIILSISIYTLLNRFYFSF
jgi:uncharacterized membrane protein